MRFTRLACAAFVAALAPMAVFPAQAEEPLTYNGALSCSALHTVLAGGQEAEGNSEDASILQDYASKWLIMAMARDGSDGERAPADYDQRTDALVDTINEMSESEAEGFLTDMLERCDAYEVAYAEEFDAIELD
tara:strand:+ start:218 stop:619 length:402 start_codon:yes stop_codon:yes gene_type:complete